MVADSKMVNNLVDLPNVTIVIPVWRDTEALLELIQDLALIPHSDIVVVHTVDETRQLQTAVGSVWLDEPNKKLQFVESPQGRACQMNAGAHVASKQFLWFLHADTRLGVGTVEALAKALRDSLWGRFDIRLSGCDVRLRFIEFLMNLRSALTGICTGDQGIFVRRDLFQIIGGYVEQPLMEDIELSKTLGNIQRPTRIRKSLITSSRRWEERGLFRTVILMWILRLRYFFGKSPRELAKIYYPDRNTSTEES